MEMKTRDKGIVTIVDIRGRVTFGESDAALRATILGLLDKGRKQILLNLEDTSYVDSSGLAQFVACYKQADEGNGRVKLLKPRAGILQLLSLTGLDSVLEVYSEEASAVASFDGRASRPLPLP
jgi:anti-sigma B factor antagonist